MHTHTRHTHHTHLSHDPNRTDKYLMVFTPEGELIRKFKHPKACYGVDFCALSPNLIATGMPAGAFDPRIDDRLL